MKKLQSAMFLAGALCAGQVALAQTPPAEKPAEPPAAPPAILSIGAFDLTGHFDFGYTYLRGSGKFVSGLNDRVFDFDRRRLHLHALDLQLASTPENGFGGVLDVTLGKDADTIAAYGTIDRDRGPANGVNRKLDITQAYFHYGAGALTLIGGKFITLHGAEVIKSPLNSNYSRSILFGYAIPFTHTGVRATYKFSDTLSLTGGVNQGWDAVKDTNSDKTLEFQAAFAPSKTFSTLICVMSGKELVTNYPKSELNGTRNLLDVVSTFNATDNLTFILNVDYGSQEKAGASGGKAKWQGVAGYANYQFNDQWRTSLRAEYFDDKDGYRTGVIQKWKETTLTLAYMPTKMLEVRAEIRGDRSDQEAFLKADRTTPTKSERSFGLELLVKF